MTPERWQQIEEVLQAALDRSPQDRASFIKDVCGRDAELRGEAVSLIDAYEQAGDFIEEPAIAQDSHVLIGDALEDKVGHEIGPYTIVERLGGGGMGEVYLARDRRLDRLVALKILPAYFAVEDARLNRFQREARAASALNHPNILTIHEVGESDGIPFIATEFIDGPTLRELIEQDNLSIPEILEIAEQVASALSEAHAASIVHRDIKPENIMRRTDGLVKILDFGIAKLIEHQHPRAGSDLTVQTEVGVVMGTVDYMSPEQARGLSVDQRTDIWSLGVVLYEMLAQRRPFTGATRMDSMVAILEREPVAIWESEGASDESLKTLRRIVDKCLRKERASRYQSATELLADLKGVRQQVGNVPETTRATLTDRVEIYRRRPSWLLMVVALLVAVFVAAWVYQRWEKVRSAENHPAAGPSSKLYSQMNETEQLAFVSEQEQHISNLMGDRPAKLSDEALLVIKRYVDRYVAMNMKPRDSEDQPLSAIYGRAQPYVPLIARSFAARKVPVIIGIYLPVIESAYRPCFENSIGAKGLFQFLPETARHYGVAHGDMCDVEKMAPAAAHYIADRMAELGEDSESLTLVLLSYNTGPEYVRNTLRELRGTEDYQRNFWTLFAHRNELNETFRNESAGYVPAFFAAAIIGENPRAFGLATPPLSMLAPQEVSSKQ
jgi:serine/threonine protein kinase/soluble lytic murein transglycosylase-like protein